MRAASAQVSGEGRSGGGGGGGGGSGGGGGGGGEVVTLVVRRTLLLRRERGGPRWLCMAQLVITIRVLLPGRNTTRMPNDDGFVRPPLQGLVFVFIARLPAIEVGVVRGRG